MQSRNLGSPRRSMERPAPQDGHPRLDPVRRPRHRPRRHDRAERPRRFGSWQRRVQARRYARQGRRLPRSGRRAGARAGQGLRQGRRSSGDGRGAGRRDAPGADRGHHRDRKPARSRRSRQHGFQGRPLGRRELHDARHGRAGRGARRPAARRRGRDPGRPPWRARRAVRRRLGHQGDRRPGRQGREEGGGHLLRPAADHPAGRVRRARRRRHPARARRHRRRGHRRPARAGQPALRAPARRGRARGDHRPRRRRGLRDVLLAPHDGGARPRPLGRGRGRDRRRHVGPRGAHLGHHRDDRDGRAAVRRQPDLRRLRHRHDARRRGRRARLDDLPARDALVPQREELAGEGPRALHHQAPPPGQGRVARLGRHPRPRPQAPARVDAGRRRPARRPLRPRARHPVQGPRLRRLLAQPAGHPDLRPGPGRLPRRRHSGHDRDQGQGRHGRAGPGRDPAAARPGAGHRPALRALQRRGQPRQDGRRRRPLGRGQRHRRRFRAIARGPALARSSRPPSAGWPAQKSP